MTKENQQNKSPPLTSVGQQYKPAPEELLEALSNHRRWVESDGLLGKAFDSAREYEELNLDGLDFSNTSLGMVTFKRCSLRKARFVAAALDCVTFEKCEVTAANFGTAHLIEAWFTATNYKEADFSLAIEGPYQVQRIVDTWQDSGTELPQPEN